MAETRNVTKTKAITTKTHLLVVPFPQSGHMIPTIDLVHQLLLRDTIVTVLITTKNLHYLDPILPLHSPDLLRPLSIPFPSHHGIPQGVENMSQLGLNAIGDMIEAFSLLYYPLAQWIKSSSNPTPVAILSDMLSLPWINKLADEFKIKSIAFVPSTAHTLSVVSKLAEPDRGFVERLMIENITKTWGLVVNSFKELDDVYIEDVKKNFMKHHRVWPVGPIVPSGTVTKDRGGKSTVHVDELKAWLDTCPENSVVYIAFGSQVSMNKAQREAIITALKKSGVRFIWTLRGGGDDEVVVVPEDLEGTKGKVIRGWAPQKVILEHASVGSYLTHMGWGSVVEAIIGGTVLLGWPLHADNHFNAKLLVDELGAAVKVCDGMESVPDSDFLARVFDESTRGEFPQRVKMLELRKMGLEAVKEGGSSYKALDNLVQECGVV